MHWKNVECLVVLFQEEHKPFHLHCQYRYILWLTPRMHMLFIVAAGGIYD